MQMCAWDAGARVRLPGGQAERGENRLGVCVCGGFFSKREGVKLARGVRVMGVIYMDCNEKWKKPGITMVTKNRRAVRQARALGSRTR